MFSTQTFSKLALTTVLSLSLLGNTVSPVLAQSYERVYNARTQKYHYVQKPTLGSRIKNFARKPIVKRTGVGTAAGIGVSALASKSLLRGGLAGAGTGLAYHGLDRSKTLQRKPLARRTLKGGVIGTGVGIAAGTALLPAAAIGLGAGAVTHGVKKHWH